MVTLLLGAAQPQLSLAADSTLTVNDPYVRLVPPSAPASAAFMVIANAGSADRKLLSAQSPAAAAVELHNHINNNGVMKMRPRPRLELPAGKTVVLKAGSYHIMLMELKRPFRSGDSVPLILTIEGRDRKISLKEVKAEVRDLAASKASPEMEHMDHGSHMGHMQ